MSTRLLLTLVLLVAAAVTGWSVWRQRPEQAPRREPSVRSDYVLQALDLTVLNREGGEAFTLRAPRLQRQPGERSMTLASPVFTIPPRAGSKSTPWELSAREGWVSAAGDELRLRGDVKAHDRDPVRPTRMATERLNVFPDTKKATTDAAITITQPGSILRARGMVAQLDRKHVLLQSNVKVRYAPPSR